MRALAFALSLALLCPTLARAQEDEPVTVDEAGLVSTTLVDVPLSEALLQLAEAADVSLVLPASTLEWVDLRVTARLRAVPLPAAFDLMLKVCGVKGRLETAGETRVLLVDLPPQEALALARLELEHAQVVAHRAELQARLVERELELRRLRDEEEEDEDEDGDELNEDGHQHDHRQGPFQGDDGEWEDAEEEEERDEEGEDEEERDEDEGHRGEQMDEEDEESSMRPANPTAEAHALVRKAATHLAALELDAARACLDQAIGLAPAQAEAYFQRALLHLKTRPRRYELAVDDLTRALELDPRRAAAFFYRAAALYDLKRYDDCLADLAAAEALGTRDGSVAQGDVHLVRGHCHFARREWPAAEAAYQAFLAGATVGHKAVEKVRARLTEARAALAGQ